MKPAFGQNQGQVRLCCCIPRGEVKLSASFDRAAYMAGETAQIKAAIVNDSEQDVAHMVVKLMRFITLRDQAGHQKHITDTVCQATYPGVAAKSQATRDLPGFWQGSWKDVQKDGRGRYPKHRWPDEPWAEKPSLKTKNAFNRT